MPKIPNWKRDDPKIGNSMNWVQGTEKDSTTVELFQKLQGQNEGSWVISVRRGTDPPHPAGFTDANRKIGVYSTKEKARKKAVRYMRKHPGGADFIGD